MSPLEPKWERRRLRAPSDDGQELAIPPLAEMPATIASNRQLIATWDISVLGKPLSVLRQLARDEILAAAMRYSVETRSATTSQSSVRSILSGPLVISGHQPDLFHAGVWFKNLVLDGLAGATGGTGLHLIVDNDTVGATSINVPVGTREHPRIERVPFDADAGSVPWEEASLRDETLFRTFAQRVQSALECWPIEPLLTSIWPAAIAHLPSARNEDRPKLAELLNAVRRTAERQFCLNNFELPVSQLCQTESFAWFVCSLLHDPQRTHTNYNTVVAEYRRVNRVRNRQHPVPDLSRGGDRSDWLEMPFWIWRSGDSRRRRMFVRTTSTELQLAGNQTVIATLRRPSAATAELTVGQLHAIAANNWKLRPRALTMTLFARVFLADAFLHGIGGAKYDEMTDHLISRLFGITPPHYLTATATCRLPLHDWNVRESDVSKLKHRLWDFQHNPERTPPGFSSADCPKTSPCEAIPLLDEKQRLIAAQNFQDALVRDDSRRAARAESEQRRLRLRAINQHLTALAGQARTKLDVEMQSAMSHLAANQVLQCREFPFCLHPADRLKSLVESTRLAFSRGAAGT